MPRFVIERNIPGAGKLSPSDLADVAKKSCSVIREMGPQIQWIQTFVTADKVFCVYIAPDEKTLMEHARRGGFPANNICRVTAVVDPTTGET